MDYSNVLATSHALTRFGARGDQAGSGRLAYEHKQEFSGGSCVACGRSTTVSQFSQIESAQADTRHSRLLTDYETPIRPMETGITVGSHPAHQYGTQNRSASRVPPAEISFRYTDTREGQLETLNLSFLVPQTADSTRARAKAFAQSAKLVGHLSKDSLLELYQIQNGLYQDVRSYSQLGRNLFEAGARVSFEESSADIECGNGPQLAFEPEVQLRSPNTEFGVILPVGKPFTSRRGSLSSCHDNGISVVLPSQGSHMPYMPYINPNVGQADSQSQSSNHSPERCARTAEASYTQDPNPATAAGPLACYSPLGRPTVWTPSYFDRSRFK